MCRSYSRRRPNERHLDGVEADDVLENLIGERRVGGNRDIRVEPVDVEDIERAIEVRITAVDDIGRTCCVASGASRIGNAPGAAKRIMDRAGEMLDSEEPLRAPMRLDVTKVLFLFEDMSMSDALAANSILSVTHLLAF
jgi:hypothetical protein